MSEEKAKQIKSIHELYSQLTGQFLVLTMGREYCWWEFLKMGFSEQDLALVIRYLEHGINNGKRNRACLKFSNLIGQLDHFEEDLGMSRDYYRNNAPATNVKKALAQLRPQAAPEIGRGNVRSVGELIAEMRKAAR